MSLKDFQDNIARMAHGMTKAEAHAKGICISCKRPPLIGSELSHREYMISGLCDRCFHEQTKEED